ncbi:MAG: TSUP family transporter [Acidobacteria bacterium]|nr:TSUP family transporter [Acidobacteriota bacterium]
MSLTLDPPTITLLVGAAFAAGFLDALAGGGGLITLPALLAVGLPPINALATNKAQAVFGVATSTVTLARKGAISVSEIRRPAVFSLTGAAVGALVVQRIDVSVLNAVIPVALGGIAMYFLFIGNAGVHEVAPRLREARFDTTVVPVIGFYDGAIGPGTGSLFATAGVVLRGRDIVSATTHAKPLNFASNLAALVVFVAGGSVVWRVGLIMIAGQAVGSYLGARTILTRGTKLIRPLIVIAASIMLAAHFGVI